MTVLTRDQGVIYAFDKENPHVKVVSPGDTLKIETYDCFEDQVQSADTIIGEIDWNRINPATGPVFVENALPGDILKVKINKIEVGGQGVLATGPNLGVMGDVLEEMETKIVQIKDDQIIYKDIKYPLNKMVGVIGVAPEGEGINCGTPGTHGGNMDTKMVEEGATLYFPVHTEGALFGLGDLHAAMGDGEVSGAGVEIAGAVTVTFDVIKGEKLVHPMLENEEVFAQIASAETLDEAVKLASKEMINRIAEKSDLPIAEITMLMSMAGETKIGQIVNPLATARFVVPKSLLKDLGVQLIG